MTAAKKTDQAAASSGQSGEGVQADAAELELARQLVGFHISAAGADLGFYAVRSYSLIRPPRTGRRWIRSRERSATGWSGRGGRSWRLRWGRRPL